MTQSIFPTYSLFPSVIRWDSYLGAYTPWEERGGIWFKREDYFAPLGYGGPNGSKLRQLIWLMTQALPGKTHVVTGASLQSPQLSMTAAVAAHLGLPCTQVVYSRPRSLLAHPSPRVAAGFGARFEYAKGPYNPILQRMVADLTRPDSLVVPYGITMPTEETTPEELRLFHGVGAYQTHNTPAEVRRLIVPAGSCNTLCSVLLGLIEHPHNVEELYTLGIGPSKWDWVQRRFERMGIGLGDLPFLWRHHSLHDSKYATYDQKFHGESWEGINFHPTYEAKMWRWLRTHNPIEPDGSTGFWIVGSDTDLRVVEPFFTHRPEEAVQ